MVNKAGDPEGKVIRMKWAPTPLDGLHACHVTEFAPVQPRNLLECAHDTHRNGVKEGKN